MTVGRVARLRALAVLVLAGVVVASCGGDDPREETSETTAADAGAGVESPDDVEFTGEPVTIGVVLPLTGVAGSIGTSTLAGIEAEVERVNAEGGILGSELRVEVRDDATDPQRGALAGRELMENPDIVAIVPSAISSIALAILPEATDKKLLAVTPALAPTVTDPASFPYSFGVTWSAAQNQAACVRRLVDLGVEKIGLIGSDDEAGRDFLSNSTAVAEDLDLEVVGQEAFPLDSKDVTANLQKLRDAGAEAVLTFPPGSSIGVVMGGMADLGWDVPVVGNAAAITGDVSELVPDSVADQLEAITTRLAARSDAERSDIEQERIDAILEQGDVTSMTNAATGVEAIAVMRYAFEKAGSFDGEAAAKALEGMSADMSIEKDTFFMFAASSPGYDATHHRPDNANTDTGFWAVVRVSELIDGTLEGEPFDIED